MSEIPGVISSGEGRLQLRDLMELGREARRRGDRAAALAYFQKAMATGAPARNFAPHHAMAAELRAQGRIAEAETLYDAILAELPESTQALVGLGFCARQLGQHERALAHFDKARTCAAASDM